MGLHTGQKVRMSLRPAPPDTGIVFRRIDLAVAGRHPGARRAGRRDAACLDLVIKDEVKVYTVEHLMSALAAWASTTCYVDLDAPEVPIMDGSASPFVLLLQQAGIEEQAAPKRFLRVKKTHRGARTATSGRGSSPTRASSCPSRSISATR